MSTSALTDVFLVSSPFQILGAFEAVGHFGSQSFLFVVQLKEHQIQDLQIHQTLLELGLSEHALVETRPHHYSIQRFARYLVDRVRESTHGGRDIGRVFIGDVRTRQFRIVAATLDRSQDRTWLLDDGTQTIRHARRMTIKGEWVSPGPLLQRILRILRERLVFRIRDRLSPRYRFFTCFDISGLTKVETIHHEFETLRNRFDLPRHPDGTCVIVGSPSINDGVVSRKVYFSIVKRARDHEGCGSDVQYRPHRRERDEDLEILGKQIGVQVVRSQHPIELSFLAEGTYPSQIIGFSSTALYTLSRVFPETRVVNVPFPMEFVHEKYKRQMSEFRDYYSGLFEEVTI